MLPTFGAGGGMSGGTSSASSALTQQNKAGDFGSVFGGRFYGDNSGNTTPKMNWWLVGGLVVAGLIAVRMLKK
jgi:hypothetical protein